MELVYSLHQLPHIAATLLQHYKQIKVWAFDADMGSGKTTLIKQLCKQLGYEGNVSSPTFSILNQYQTNNNLLIIHADLYRIKNLEEAIEVGLEEEIQTADYSFVEWFQVAKQLLPENYLYISIEAIEKDSRRLTTEIR